MQLRALCLHQSCEGSEYLDSALPLRRARMPVALRPDFYADFRKSPSMIKSFTPFADRVRCELSPSDTS